MPQTLVLTSLKKYTDWMPTFVHRWPQIVLIIATLLLLVLVLRLLLRLWDWRQVLHQKYVFIEITPPFSANKTPLQSTEWLNHIHGIGLSRTAQEKLARLHFTVSLELPSARRDGIRYVVRVPEAEVELFNQAVVGHLNSAHVQVISDYLPENLDYKNARVLSFKQSGVYYLPLKEQASFQAHDPVGQLSSAMTGLQHNEMIALQLIAKPAILRENIENRQRVMNNEDVLARSKSHRGMLFQLTLGLPFKLLGEVMYFATDFAHSSPSGSSPADSQLVHEHQVERGIKPARSITTHEQDVNTNIRDKVQQTHFRVEVRALIVAKDRARTNLYTKAMKGAIATYKTDHQELKAQWSFPAFILNRHRLYKFKHRLPSLFWHRSNKLSASEIADIYHFPAIGTVTEGMAASYSRTLSAPLSLKQDTDYDVVIGNNDFHGRLTPIGLTTPERARHMYIIGSTGTGKTTLLQAAIMQNIREGKNVGVIDPHGDLAEFVIRNIPEERKNDVVYLNPDDLDFPPGINLAEIDPQLTSTDRLKVISRRTNIIIESMRKVFSEDGTGGHRIEAILRNGLQTAMTIEGATLFTIQKLYRNKAFRDKVVDKLTDQRLKDFWIEEIGKAGEMQRVSMTKGVTEKLDRFEGDPFISRIFGQKESTINFDEILDGKILICNLSKGKIGSDNSSLLGTVVLSLIQLAAEARARRKIDDRQPFYLYVDEFQNFATLSFAEMVAEARKYGLYLTMAQQTTAQLGDKNIAGIMLGNIGTIVCFRTGNADDERLLLPFFRNFLQPGEISNLPAHHFYARLASMTSQAPLSGITIVPEDSQDDKRAQQVIEASRTNYATKYEPESSQEAAETPEDPEDGETINPQKETA